MASTVWSRAGVANSAGAPFGAAVTLGQSTRTRAQAQVGGKVFGAAATGASFFAQPQVQFQQNMATLGQQQAQIIKSEDAPLDPISNAWSKAGSWLLRGLQIPVEATANWASTGIRTAIHDPESIRSPFSAPDFSRLNGDAWEEDWEDTVTAGASVGQTLERALNAQNFDLLDDPAQAEAKQEYYSSAQQRFTTGLFDVAWNVFADPLVLVGKAGSVIKATRGVVEAEDVTKAANAFDKSELTGKAKDLRTVWDEVIDLTEPATHAKTEKVAPGTVAALSRTKYFQQSSDQGAIPYLLGRANEMPEFAGDAASRVKFKRDLLAAGAGDTDALARVEERSALLRVELENMHQPNEQVRLAREFMKPDGDMESLFTHLNDGELWQREVKATRPLIAKEFEALERVKKIGYASGSRVEGATANRGELANLPVGSVVTGFSRGTGTGREVARIAKTIQTGRFTTPVHIVTGRHLPSVFRLSDQDAPNVFAEAITRAHRSGLVPRETLAQLSDDFASAASMNATATKAQRGDILRRYEAAVDKGLAEKYGANLDEVQAMMRAVRDRRSNTLAVVQKRAYTAQPADGFAVIRDDAEAFALGPDIVKALGEDTPIMGTQLADTVSLIDPKAMDAFMRRHSGNLAGFVEKVETGFRATEQLMTATTRLWKFGALFRLAYPMRVQIDSQARALATLGAMEYFQKAVTSIPHLAYNNLKRVDTATADQLGRKFSAFKALDDVEWEVRQTGVETPELAAKRAQAQAVIDEPAVKPAKQKRRVAGTEMAMYLGKNERITADGRVVGGGVTGRRIKQPEAYRSTEEMQRVLSFMDARVSTMGLLTDGEASLTRKYRSTGAVDLIGPDNPRWEQAYLQAVNHQVRNDKAAMMIAANASDDDILQWVNKTDDGRSYWRELAPHYGEGGQSAWLIKLRQHVDTLLPDEGIRVQVATRNLRQSDLPTIWPNSASRPQVPAELLENRPVGSALMDLYQGAEEKFFRIASEMPENMMARHPLYVARYQSRMRQLVADSGGDADKLTLEQIGDLKRKASIEARRDIGKVMFDTSTNTNLGYHMRFLSPFYSAWWDMMTKWSHIMGNNLEVLPLVIKGATVPNRAGVVTDDDGNLIDADGKVRDPETGEVIKDLGVGALTEGNIILPVPEWVKDWSGAGDAVVSKKALNVIFQGEPLVLPGPGPLVSISTNEVLMKTFPDLERSLTSDNSRIGAALRQQGVSNAQIRNAIPGVEQADSLLVNYLTSGFGVTEDSVLEQNTPMWVKNIKTAVLQDRSEARFSQSFAQEYQSILSEIRNGDLEQMDVDKIEDLAAQRTRNKFILQFLGSYASPVSTRPQGRFNFYLQQYRNYQRDFGLEAYDRFVADYPEYQELAISLSENTTGLQATDEAWQSTRPYTRDIARNPEYGWFFAGANNLLGEFSPDVYTAQKALEISPGSGTTSRRNKSVDEIVKDNAVRAGWADYMKVTEQLKLQLEQRGLSSFASNDAADLRQIKNQFTDDLKHENPLWAAEFATRESGEEAEKFLSYAVEQVDRHPEMGDRSDVQALHDYLQVRSAIQGLLAQEGAMSLPQVTDAAALENPRLMQMRQVWDAFTSELTANDLGFGQMYERGGLGGDTLALKRGVAENPGDEDPILGGVWADGSLTQP